MVKVDLRFYGESDKLYTKMLLNNPTIEELKRASEILYRNFETKYGKIHPHEDMILDGFNLKKQTKNTIYLTVRWAR